MLINGRKETRQKLKEVNSAVKTVVKKRNPDAPEEFFQDIQRVMNATAEIGVHELRLYLIYQELAQSFEALMRAALDAQKEEAEQPCPGEIRDAADMAMESGTH